MAVEQVNDFSIMVERVALTCVLTVRCTTWINFVYSSCNQGQRVAPRWFHVYLHASGRLRNRVPPRRSCLLVKILVALFLIVIALTHNKCTRGFLLVGKHTKEVYGVMEIMVNFLYYYCWRVASEVHKFGWILAHRVCEFLNMQPPIMVKLN
jgi:hypothetical protein